jgi:hypothetical protein
MNWKGYERKRSWRNVNIPASVVGLRKISKNLSLTNGCLETVTQGDSKSPCVHTAASDEGELCWSRDFVGHVTPSLPSFEQLCRGKSVSFCVPTVAQELLI